MAESDSVTQAFLRICEALGIQATPLAYLEVPAIIRAAGRDRTDSWKDLLPSGYRIEIDPSMAPDIYVLYRDGQKFEGEPVGHCWPSHAKAVCYAHYLNGAIGSPDHVMRATG